VRLFTGIALSLGFAAAAGASPLLWSLSGVTFTDGSTATGSFLFDADTSTYSSIDIVTSTGSIAGSTYLFTNPALPAVGSSILAAFPTSSQGIGTLELLLQYVSALTDAGGTDALSFGAKGPCQDSACDVINADRMVNAGEVTTNGVPEPSSVVLCLLGVVLFVRRSLPAVAAR
jgi:hypothetical protein